MRYLFLIILLTACTSAKTDVTAQQAKWQEQMSGGKDFFVIEELGRKCFTDWRGDTYMFGSSQAEVIEDHTGGVDICYVGKACDYRNPKKCVWQKLCTEWVSFAILQQTFLDRGFHQARCPR